MNNTKPLARLIVLFSLAYFLQGGIVGYFSSFNKPYLIGAGIPINYLAILSSLLLVPFILKFFVAYVSDKFPVFGMGRRLPYIGLGLILVFTSCFLAANISPTGSFYGFAASLLGLSLGTAIFDTAVDGLAVDVAGLGRAHIVQATMVASRAIGMAAFAYLFGAIIDSGSLAVGFVALAIIALFTLIVTVCSRIDSPVTPFLVESKSGRVLTREIVALMGYGMLFAGVCWGGIDGLITVFLRSSDVQFDGQQIGYFGALKGAGVLLGCLIGARTLKRIDGIYPYVLGALCLSVSALCVVLTPSVSGRLVAAVAWGAAFGYQITLISILAIKGCRPEFGAFMFALVMGVCNVGLSVGEGMAVKASAVWGAGSVLLALALLCLGLIPLGIRLKDAQFKYAVVPVLAT